jgi:hypothetical protein
MARGGVQGRIEFKDPEMYRLRTQQGWDAIHRATGPRSFQGQITGKMRERKLMNRKTMRMATVAVSGVSAHTTSRGWKKSDLDRLEATSTSNHIRFTADSRIGLDTKESQKEK